MSFIGVIYRNMGEELLTGAEMTQRRVLYHQTPLLYRSLEHTVQPAHGSASWRISFPGSLAGLSLVRFGSALQLGSSESDPTCFPANMLIWEGGA